LTQANTIKANKLVLHADYLYKATQYTIINV